MIGSVLILDLDDGGAELLTVWWPWRSKSSLDFVFLFFDEDILYAGGREHLFDGREFFILLKGLVRNQLM